MTTVVADVLARARKLRREGTLDESEKLYREALEQQPKHFAALRELGALCLKRGRPDDALRPFTPVPENLDLLVIGIGNSLFGPLINEPIIQAAARAKTSIGIFGMQYR
ncbi:MAG: tetratricopeptide repeat protein [Methyloceanibacter sp.]